MEEETHRANMLDKMGRFRTSSLFWETRGDGEERYAPLYTLKPRNMTKGSVTYLSLKQIYLSYTHIPGLEYEFATDIFGSWEHWVYLCDKSQLRPHFAQWREELEVKIRAEGVKSLIDVSKTSLPGATAAAKYLADKGWESRAGRPSKEDKAKALKIDNAITKTLEDDYERIGLRSVN